MAHNYVRPVRTRSRCKGPESAGQPCWFPPLSTVSKMQQPMRYKSFLIYLGVASAAFTSQAEEVSLAGRQVNIPAPPGYCIANKTSDEKEVASRIAYGMGPNNKLLMYFVECKELARVRAGTAGYTGGFNDYVVVGALAPKGEIRAFDGVTRAQYLRLLSKDVAQDTKMEEGINRAMKRVREFGPGDQSVQNFGILGSDENGAYMSIVTIGSPQDGTKGVEYSLSLGSLTLVKGLRLGYTAVRLSKSTEDLPSMLSLIKATSATVVTANK